MRGANLAGQVDRVIAEVERFREALEGKRAILGCLDLWTDLGGADRVRLSQALGASRPGQDHAAVEPWRRAQEAAGARCRCGVVGMKGHIARRHIAGKPSSCGHDAGDARFVGCASSFSWSFLV
jgi:hypothetical protein